MSHKVLRIAGHRGLEVRGHGARPTFPMDLHRGRAGGDGGHHPAGAHALRQEAATRHPTLRDRAGHRPPHGRHQQGGLARVGQ